MILLAKVNLQHLLSIICCTHFNFFYFHVCCRFVAGQLDKVHMLDVPDVPVLNYPDMFIQIHYL